MPRPADRSRWRSRCAWWRPGRAPAPRCRRRRWRRRGRAAPSTSSADLLRPEARRPRLTGPRPHRLRLDDVGAADEIGDEARARTLVDLLGRADLDDAAVVEDGDAVGHRQRLALVVGDEDEGEAERRAAGSSVRPASPRGASGRARRAARRGGAPSAGRRGRGRARRAGAGRRRAGSACAPPCRRA